MYGPKFPNALMITCIFGNIQKGRWGFLLNILTPMAEDLLNNREKVVGELVGEIRKAINKMKKILKKGP